MAKNIADADYMCQIFSGGNKGEFFLHFDLDFDKQIEESIESIISPLGQTENSIFYSSNG